MLVRGASSPCAGSKFSSKMIVSAIFKDEPPYWALSMSVSFVKHALGRSSSGVNPALLRQLFQAELSRCQETPCAKNSTQNSKLAMKAGDKRRVETIRMINAALKDRDIDARGQGKTVSDDDILALLQKLVKSRQESAEIYEKAGRIDLSTQEREEIAIIQSFLPQPLSPAEVEAAIAAAIAEAGATSIKEMGKVIGAAQVQICRPHGFCGRQRGGEGEARKLGRRIPSPSGEGASRSGAGGVSPPKHNPIRQRSAASLPPSPAQLGLARVGHFRCASRQQPTCDAEG